MSWLTKLALSMSPVGSVIGAIWSAIRKFFSALDAQGWIGLIASVGLALVALHQWSEARHWKKQSGQFEKLYRADEVSAQRIASEALNLKAKTDTLNARISAVLKERAHEEFANNAADADALRVRGPGKAACAGNPGPPAAASGRVSPAPAANAAVDQVPDGAGTALIGLPFDDTVSFAQSYDDLLAEVKAWRDDDAQIRKAWPKSTATIQSGATGQPSNPKEP